MASETPLIDFAPKALVTIIRCQNILADYITPETEMTAEQCINKLLGVLDDQELVRKMREINVGG